MADLPMAQIPNFSLGGGQVTGDNFGKGLTQGYVQGTQLGQNQQAVNIQQQQANQQAQYQQALIQQAQQKQQQEQGNAIAKNALDAYDAYGDAAGAESFNAFKKGMNMMAPGSVDPNAQWDNSMGDALKTANDAFSAATEGKRPWPEAIGVISRTISAASKQQRARMEPILTAAQDQFNQTEATSRQQSSQDQDTQRAYAAHAEPLIQNGSSLNTINQLLDQNTATGDAAAKTLIERNLANGSISQDDADKLTSAGGPLEKLTNYWHTIGTGKQFDDTHRAAMKNWTETKVKEINNTLKATATAYPGAAPAQVPVRKTSKSKSGKPIFSDDGGTTWQYQ